MNHEPSLRCEHCGAIVDPRTEFHACARCGCNPATGLRETGGPNLGAMTDQTKILAAIAKRHLGLDTLQERGSDRLDFIELGVVSVRLALEAAFRAGVAAASAKPAG